MSCRQLWTFYAEVVYEHEKLWYRGIPIDIIISQSLCGNNSVYNSTGRIKNSAVSEAYRNGAVELFTPPSSLIAGTKLAFDLLLNPEMQTRIALNADEKEALKTLPTSIHSEKVASFDSYHKDEYVIKLTGKGQGAGVILGTTKSEEEWHATLSNLKERGKKFILQERVQFMEDEIFLYDESRATKSHLTLEPFLINNPQNGPKPTVSGYSCRAILPEDYDHKMKFNPAYDRDYILFGHVIEHL